MERKDGILKMIGDRAVNNSPKLVDKIHDVMSTKMGSGKEIGDYIKPYEMFTGLIEIFQNQRINAEPKFAKRVEAIESLIFGNDDLQDIFHDDEYTIADYGLALIIAGGVMMDMDYYADDVVKDKIKAGTMTKEDLQDMADSNIQGLQIDTIQLLKKMFVKDKCGDCENCDACMGTPVDEGVKGTDVKGTLPEEQRASLYMLINDGQITSDTIHNLITSGSVTVPELIANIKPDVLGPLMQGVHDIVSKTLGKAGHSVTETKDRTILRGASVKSMSNSKGEILEAMDRLKGGVSEDEKRLRERIAAGELSDAELADAIYTFKVNPYFVDLHISDEKKEILGKMLTERLFKI
jgi:hypothetical protein